MAQNKFKISLRENGEHSFARGIKAFEEYSRNHDGFLLKDAIIFSHHGIELLMKEILVKKSEYLIFEELKELPKKQIDADRQNIDIFSLERPPRTVSYDIALDRVQAFIKPAELDSTLRQSLDQLNRLRNQIEHYSIEIDRKEVEQILATIHEPLLKLFEVQIGKLSLLRSSNIDKAWNNIQRSVQDESVKILEVYDIVRKFKGQKVIMALGI